METGMDIDVFSNAPVLVACRDLMFRSKIETTLRHMGLRPHILRPSDDPAAILAAGQFSLVIVDLGVGSDRWQAIVAAARAARPPLSPLPTPVLAFGAHVDRAAQSEARSAGCDLVVANSRLARELSALVERLLGRGASD
jgi:DNA-binding NarL/FixJ family response regulator